MYYTDVFQSVLLRPSYAIRLYAFFLKMICRRLAISSSWLSIFFAPFFFIVTYLPSGDISTSFIAAIISSMCLMMHSYMRVRSWSVCTGSVSYSISKFSMTYVISSSTDTGVP